MTVAPVQRSPRATPDPIIEFAAETAHDFNNLLGVIIANLDLLSEMDQSTEASHLVEEAMTAALRGSELARNLLRTTHGLAPAPPDPVASAADVHPAGTVGHGELVLVVDDNVPLRRAVVQELEALGYRTLEAGDGPAALLMLNSQPVNLLFTDV